MMPCCTRVPPGGTFKCLAWRITAVASHYKGVSVAPDLSYWLRLVARPKNQATVRRYCSA